MALMAPNLEEIIMFRKLSLIAVAAASLGVAALARPPPRPGVVVDGTADGMAVAAGTAAGVVRASTSVVAPAITAMAAAMATAAAMCGNWSRPRGARAGA
jgi:hypothetical protein